MSIAQRYLREREALDAACEQSGRDPEDVLLLAVSKTVGPDGVREAYEAGCRDFGENRPDQLVQKAQAFPDANWHFIGNIQSRRIPDIVAHAGLIHSVHTLRHAQKIDSTASKLGKVQDILIEVNASGEESKSGVSASDAQELLMACVELPNVRVRGLMTMAAQGDLTAALKSFVSLRELESELIEALKPGEARDSLNQLSMGMSEDWREAVEAGSTMVRIGRAIFSDDFE